MQIISASITSSDEIRSQLNLALTEAVNILWWKMIGLFWRENLQKWTSRGCRRGAGHREEGALQSQLALSWFLHWQEDSTCNVLKSARCEIPSQSFGEPGKPRPLRSFHPLPCSTPCVSCWWESLLSLGKDCPAEETPSPNTSSLFLHPPSPPPALRSTLWTTRTHFSKEITPRGLQTLPSPFKSLSFH